MGGCWECWVGGALAAPTLCRPSSPHRPGAGIAPSVNHPHTQSRVLFRALTCTCTADCSPCPGTRLRHLSSVPQRQQLSPHPTTWMAGLAVGCPVFSGPCLTPRVCTQLCEAYGHQQGHANTHLVWPHPGRQGRVSLEQKITTRKKSFDS